MPCGLLAPAARPPVWQNKRPRDALGDAEHFRFIAATPDSLQDRHLCRKASIRVEAVPTCGRFKLGSSGMALEHSVAKSAKE